LYEPTDLELDLARAKMYWTERQSSRIGRANLNGSGIEYLFVADAIAPAGLALDLLRDLMYWTDPQTLRIFRADFEVTFLDVLADSDLAAPGHIALDLSDGLAIRGDLNCDGAVNFCDINPFVLALSDPAGYAAAYPRCIILNADINANGTVGFDDINPFVRLLTQP
jgi:hypothetical protein